MNKQFFKGMHHGIPIALGYLSVSFGFGIMAVKAGLSVPAAAIISITNLTSAGQAAGVSIIAAGGSLLEMALTQLTINIRYALMSISLSQKLDGSFTTPRRLIAAYGITDEIFAVASAQRDPVSPWYMYGMILVAFLGWTAGTVTGAAAGQILPSAISDAMGIVLYGMFLAIIIPAARKVRSIFFSVAIAAAISVIFKYLLPGVSGGFSVIISAVVSAAAVAAMFPLRKEEEAL